MDKSEVQKMMEALDNAGGGNSAFWTPEEGKNHIRILPHLKKKDETAFFFSHMVHWIDGTPYECLDQTITDKNGELHKAEHCPACAMSKKLYRISDENSEERKLARDLARKTRYLYRIVVRGKENEAEPEFYETGPSIFDKIKSIIKSGEYGIIIDPLEGRDFIIDRKGTGRRTNYDSSLPAANVTPIFKSKEKIKEVFLAAEKLDYTANIEFVSQDQLKGAVKMFLNPTQDANSVSKSSSKKEEKESEDFEGFSSDDFDDEDDNISTETNDASDDQIDDILSEFM